MKKKDIVDQLFEIDNYKVEDNPLVVTRSESEVISEILEVDKPLTQDEKKVVAAFMRTPNDRLVSMETGVDLVTIKRILAKSNVISTLPTDALAMVTREELERKGLVATVNETAIRLTDIIRDDNKPDDLKLKAIDRLLDIQGVRRNAGTVSITANTQINTVTSDELQDRIKSLLERRGFVDGAHA